MAEGPKCPKIDQLQADIDVFADLDYKSAKLDKAVYDRVLNALEWTITHLENRDLYHKKQNVKNRILREKMKELGFDGEVDSLTNDAVFNIAAGGK